MTRKVAPAFLWGKSYVSECPFCKTLADQYEGGACPHLVTKLPLGRPVFMFEG